MELVPVEKVLKGVDPIRNHSKNMCDTHYPDTLLWLT
jgi:hypothetical protein